MCFDGSWSAQFAMIGLFTRATLNSMNFPAGIIQSPFFSEHYPAQWNFASLGSVMGHELTHGFDDEGRKLSVAGSSHVTLPESSLSEWITLIDADFPDRLCLCSL
jgi:predicted metalloendopeptidase